jgi:NitT/TauT family transport system ATP-binding protein
MSYLDFQQVTYNYDLQLKVVDGVNWSIDQGEFHCLVGRSGCGKTTLLKLAAGLIQPDDGTICLQGQPRIKPSKEVGFVFQTPTLLEWKTAADNVLLPVSLQRQLLDSDRKRAIDILSQMGLSGLEHRYPGELSGGQQSRVALARALFLEPALLLLDEPFAALDAITREELQDDLLKICRSGLTTIFFVTHDIHEAVYLADHVTVMHQGQLSKSFKIDLPRPRQRDMRYAPSFIAQCAQVRQAMDGYPK